MTRDELEHFFAQTRWEGEHLIWTGACSVDRRDSKPYHTPITSIRGLRVRAARVALKLYMRRGLEPRRYALHTRDCGIPRCLRFEHLYEGTAHDNVQDMIAVGRHWKVNDV